jgi:glycerol uptake facilitator-like aquaporin
MFAKTLNSVYSTISSAAPPGFVVTLLPAFIENGAYFSAWQHEFFGALLMVLFTFSPGKWIGTQSQAIEWGSHAVGVVGADKIGGGPHVNPSVSVCMFALGKCSYTECVVRIAGHMAGGLLAFPLAQLIAESFGWTPLGGPEYSADPVTDDASAGVYNEFLATFFLLIAIYVLNFEVNFGKFHYWIKQILTAACIRYLIVVFGTSGPAMNPMLATTWAVFASSSDHFPTDAVHYLVYWVASILGGLLATLLYVVYAGGTFFGYTLPLGPMKKGSVVDTTASKKKK